MFFFDWCFGRINCFCNTSTLENKRCAFVNNKKKNNSWTILQLFYSKQKHADTKYNNTLRSNSPADEFASR